MSIFSILNKASGVGDSISRVLSKPTFSTVRDLLPDSVENDLVGAGSKFASARNSLGLGPRVPKNNKPQFDIDKFTAEVSKGGYATPNRFTVELNPPEDLGGITAERIRMRCFATSLPGKTLMLQDNVWRHGYGMIDKVPHATMFNDVTLSFLVDSEGEIPALFEKWMSTIHSADVFDDQGEDINKESNTVEYLVNYKNNYSVPIEIRQLDTLYGHTFGVKLRKAFPISIGEQQLAWDSNNNIAVLPVTFTYIDYEQI